MKGALELPPIFNAITLAYVCFYDKSVVQSISLNKQVAFLS